MNWKERTRNHEGLRLLPYKDTLGYLTIGHGRCLDKIGISISEADMLFQNDCMRVMKEVNREFTWVLGLNEARQGVIYEMAFQLGLGGVKNFKKMIAAIREQQWGRAANEMIDSGWHKQTPQRCEQLAQIMLTGENH